MEYKTEIAKSQSKTPTGLTFVEVVKATTPNRESSKHLNHVATPLDGQTEPTVSGTPSTTRKIGKIHKFMVEEEIKFWENSMVCYVTSANLPLQVIEGFVRRIWNALR